MQFQDESMTAPFDGLAFLFALIGSFSMGSYSVPIKAPSVLSANVHPLVFQCYKSFWVFSLGWLFIFVNLLREKPAYQFTYWGILGAAAWIPSGLGTIAAVPRLGVGMTAVINTGASACLQFLVGQLVGERIKRHGTSGYVLAPYYLIAVVLGMTGLVLAPTVKCDQGKRTPSAGHPGAQPVGNDGEGDAVPLRDDSDEGVVGAPRLKEMAEGIFFAFLAGVFSALMFAVITIGKKVESERSGDPDCESDYSRCPEWFKNQFDCFGSYMVTFGIGAGSVTALYLGLFAGAEKAAGRQPPESHFGVLKVLGSVAGCCWVVGNVFQSAAVSRGGSTVFGPANQALQLITSGAWGLLYYREVKAPVRILCWVLSAAWTVVFVVLLGREKV